MSSVVVRTLLVVAIALPAGGCDPIVEARQYTPDMRRCRSPIQETSFGVVTVCGPLTPSLAEAFKGQLKDRTHTLRISSPGGDTRAAMEIAREVRSRRLEVVVDGVCESACAYLVLNGAARVRLRPGSIVTFHHTTSLVAAVAAQWNETRRLADTRSIAVEEAFYRENRASTEALYQAGLALGPVCVGAGRMRGEVMPVLFSRMGPYVPTRQEIRAFIPRIDLENYPRDEQDAKARYARFHAGKSAKLVYGSPEALRTRSWAAQMEIIPPCQLQAGSQGRASQDANPDRVATPRAAQASVQLDTSSKPER